MHDDRGCHEVVPGVEACTIYPQTVHASFVRPCLLPAQCTARIQQHQGAEFVVVDASAGRRVLVEGAAEIADA